MLGYDAGSVAKPYHKARRLRASRGALSRTLLRGPLLRGSYPRLSKDSGPIPCSFIAAPAAVSIITLLVIIFNVVSVRRKVREGPGDSDYAKLAGLLLVENECPTGEFRSRNYMTQ